MANNMTSNPWVIDTPSAAVLFKTDVFVEQIEFVDYSVQGSQCIIQDRFGKTVWKALGAADLEMVRSGKLGYIHGLVIPTLQNSGIARVYFK